MRFVDKDLLSVQEARILMENAGEARKVLAGFEKNDATPGKDISVYFDDVEIFEESGNTVAK